MNIIFVSCTDEDKSFKTPFHILLLQVSEFWPAAQFSCPDSPCWSQAACSSRHRTSPTPAPTPAWPATPEASTRPQQNCWCGVSELAMAATLATDDRIE